MDKIKLKEKLYWAFVHTVSAIIIATLTLIPITILVGLVYLLYEMLSKFGG